MFSFDASPEILRGGFPIECHPRAKRRISMGEALLEDDTGEGEI